MGEADAHGGGLATFLYAAEVNHLPAVAGAEFVQSGVEAAVLFGVDGFRAVGDGFEKLGCEVAALAEAGKNDADVKEWLIQLGSISPESIEHTNEGDGGIGFWGMHFSSPCDTAEVAELEGERAGE